MTPSPSDDASISPPVTSATQHAVEFRRWARLADARVAAVAHAESVAAPPPPLVLGFVIDTTGTADTGREIRLLREASGGADRAGGRGSTAAVPSAGESSFAVRAASLGASVAEATVAESGDRVVLRLLPMGRRVCGRAVSALMRSLFVCARADAAWAATVGGDAVAVELVVRATAGGELGAPDAAAPPPCEWRTTLSFTAG